MEEKIRARIEELAEQRPKLQNQIERLANNLALAQRTLYSIDVTVSELRALLEEEDEREGR